MKTVVAYPPNFEEIAERFPFARNPGVIFTYGETIFNPSNAQIGGALRAHEAVHAQRQGTEEAGIQAWWRRYLDDPMFRLEEELLAHRTEYRASKTYVRDRNALAVELDSIARRLSGPLYGGLISYQQARRFITVDVDPKAVAKVRRLEVTA